MPSVETTKVRIFCSYADADQKLETRLEKQLSSLERRNQVFIWNKHKVKLGQRRSLEIDEQINRADIILLLISPDFIDSDDCYAVQLNKALQRQTDGKTRIVPILLRPCNWQNLRFSEYQILPRNQIPVTHYPKGQDAAFQKIVEEIDVIVQEFLQHGPGCIEPLRSKQPDNDTNKIENVLRYTLPKVSANSAMLKNGRSTRKNSGRHERTRKETLKAEESVPSSNKYVKTLPKERSSPPLESLAKLMARFIPIKEKTFVVICLINVLLIPAIIGLWLINHFSITSMVGYIVSFLIPIAISSVMLILCPITNSRKAAKFAVVFFTLSWTISGWTLNWLIATSINWIRTRGTLVGTISQTGYAIPVILMILLLIASFCLHLVIAFETNFLIKSKSRGTSSKRVMK